MNLNLQWNALAIYTNGWLANIIQKAGMQISAVVTSLYRLLWFVVLRVVMARGFTMSSHVSN